MRPLSQFGPAAIERWLGSLELAPASKKAYLSSTRAFCRWLVDTGAIASDPTAKIPPVRVPKAPPRAQSREAVKACFEACRDDRERLIIELMCQMGLRRAEVAGARWENYDDAELILRVVGKGDKAREIPVPRRVARLMARQQYRKAYGPIISSLSQPGHHLTPTRLGIVTTNIMVRAGVKQRAWDGVTPHALRHTAASDVLDNCHDLRVVQALLGHEQLSSTAVYLRRAAIGQIREAMEGRDYDEAA